MPLPAFKAYDIRGRVPDELNEDLARRIGVALSDQLEPGTVVVGHDVRLTSAAQIPIAAYSPAIRSLT